MPTEQQQRREIRLGEVLRRRCVKLVTLATCDGRVARRSALTTRQKTILTASTCPNRPGSLTSPARPAGSAQAPPAHRATPCSSSTCSSSTPALTNGGPAGRPTRTRERAPTICGGRARKGFGLSHLGG